MTTSAKAAELELHGGIEPPLAAYEAAWTPCLCAAEKKIGGRHPGPGPRFQPLAWVFYPGLGPDLVRRESTKRPQCPQRAFSHSARTVEGGWAPPASYRTFQLGGIVSWTWSRWKMVGP